MIQQESRLLWLTTAGKGGSLYPRSGRNKTPLCRYWRHHSSHGKSAVPGGGDAKKGTVALKLWW